MRLDSSVFLGHNLLVNGSRHRPLLRRLARRVTRHSGPLAVTLSLVIVAAALPRSWQDLRLWLFLAACGAGVGVLAAGPLAWAATDAVLERANPFRSIIWRLSVRAIALGALLIAAPLAITSGPPWLQIHSQVTLSEVGEQIVIPVLQRVGLAAFAFVYGVVIFGLPALALTTPIVAAWSWLMRRLFASKS